VSIEDRFFRLFVGFFDSLSKVHDRALLLINLSHVFV